MYCFWGVALNDGLGVSVVLLGFAGVFSWCWLFCWGGFICLHGGFVRLVLFYDVVCGLLGGVDII